MIDYNSVTYLSRFTKSYLTQERNTNYGKLWKLFADQLNEIEAQMDLLKMILVVIEQSGITLDLIGTILNTYRNPGKPDSIFMIDLFAAISSIKSHGSIPELISVGKLVGGAYNEVVFRPFELWRLSGLLVWNASVLLDGHDILSPNAYRPASLVSTIEGDIFSTATPTNVGNIIDGVRAGGVSSIYSMIYNVWMSDIVIYLFGKTEWGNIKYVVLGDGSDQVELTPAKHADAAPAGTLKNEIIRKAIIHVVEDGLSYYRIRIYEEELNGYNINEIALLDSSSNILAYGVFSNISKSSSFMLTFKMIDDIN